MNTVKCPKCGTENLNTYIRCEKCNEQLITVEQFKEQYDDYNLSYELKKQLKEEKEYEEKNQEIIDGIGYIVGAIVTSLLPFGFIFCGADDITKKIGLVVLLLPLSFLIYGISMIIIGIKKKKNGGVLDTDKYSKFGSNIILFLFILVWFGFLITFDVIAIKTWNIGGDKCFYFSLILWIIGIYYVIKEIKYQLKS